MELMVEEANRIFYQSEALEFSATVARAERYAPHVHPGQFQVEVLLHGETECGLGQKRYPLPQRHYSLVNPDVEHYNLTQTWKHALFLIFERSFLDETAWQIYRFLSRPVAFSDVIAPCSPDLMSILHTLLQEVQQPDQPGRLLFFETILVQLSVTLLRALRGSHTASALAALDASGHARRIARAIELIRSNFQQDLSLDDLARAAGMSRYHFLRSFKALVGKTPYAYVMQMRVRAAAALLRSTSQAITAIATECGFASPSHFGAVFRRVYLCSPSTYRHDRLRKNATI